MSEGRILPEDNGFTYEYSLKDHLGNTRLTFQPGEIEPDIREYNYYYPFGIRIPRKTEPNNTRYLFNGKEELENETGYELNWYHYGARYYDPQIGRWNSMDPADEFHSPYVYVGNDPIRCIDSDGKWGWITNRNWFTSIFLRTYKAHADLDGGSYLYSHQFNVDAYQNRINSYVNVWNNKGSGHYAPNIANTLKTESIPLVKDFT